MRKNITVKPKNIKGGAKSNFIDTGPILPQSLYRSKYIEKNIDKIDDKYDNLVQIKKEEVNNIKGLIKQAETNLFKNREQGIKYKSVSHKIRSDTINNIYKFINIIGRILKFLIVDLLINITKEAISIIKYVGNVVVHGGQGIILKIIFGIILIAIIFLGGFGILSLFTGNSKNISNTNDVSKSILQSNNKQFIQKPESISFISKFQNWLYSFIPNEYKYKLSSFSNSINYITTGKNQYEDYLIDRETTDIGRCDDIFHINFNKWENNKTFSVIEPEDIILEFNKNLYPESDFNKIDSDLIDKHIKYNTTKTFKIIINDNPNEKNYGKYILNTISEEDSSPIIKKQKPYIKPIFIYDNKDKSLIQFNKFNNIPIKSHYNSYNILGCYGCYLINPMYKGPIMRIKAETKENIKQEFNIYSDVSQTIIYYTKDNSKIFLNTDNFANLYITILYDQSGNEKHFKFNNTNNNNDNKYEPYFIFDDTIKKYIIKFYTRNILYLEEPIISEKMRIEFNIKVSNIGSVDNYSKIEDYMDLLANRNNSLIKIKFENSEKNMFKIIDNNDEITTLNEQQIYNINQYISGNISIINGNIEYLGCINDPRTQSDLILGKIDDKSKYLGKGNIAGDVQGEKLDELVKKHNFIGYLYNLKIYKI